MTYEDMLRINWRRFLIASATDPHIRKIRADVGDHELLPSDISSWWMPREWSGGRLDTIAVDVGGRFNPLDLYVHELGHKRWTFRSFTFKTLLDKYIDVLNLCEDVRVEYLISTQWGYTFRSWSYPQKPRVKLTPQDYILWGLYIKKVAHSRGESVPREWRDFLSEFWNKIEEAYEELIRIKDEEDYKNFLIKWFPNPPRTHPYHGSLDVDIPPSQREFEERCTASRQLAERLDVGTRGRRYGDWFDYSIPPPPLPPALTSLLNRLMVEETERIPVPYGGRYSYRRDLRGRKDFYLQSRSERRKEVSIIVDTSGSMEKVSKEVRVLLAGLNSLAKRGVEGKVIFVAGGKVLPLSLPTSQPIWAVRFQGGTSGYRRALSYIRDDDLILVISDLMIDIDDRKTVKELQGKEAYFLYGGDAYQQLLSEAKQLGFTKNLCFAPTIVGALQKMLTLLGL